MARAFLLLVSMDTLQRMQARPRGWALRDVVA
jgi:hypothetical protein